jgi:hypothetical protein
MKKQNAINKLAFNKGVVTELNDQVMKGINGGTFVSIGNQSISCSWCISSSNGNFTREFELFNGQL